MSNNSESKIRTVWENGMSLDSQGSLKKPLYQQVKKERLVNTKQNTYIPENIAGGKQPQFHFLYCSVS